MPDPHPAEPWKLARLIVWLGVMIAFLAAGSYARLRWGVPDEPYGETINTVGWHRPRNENPFEQLEAVLKPRNEWKLWNGKDEWTSDP